MKTDSRKSPQQPAARSGILTVGLLVLVLVVLFHRSFLPAYVHFSNDGPLGAQNAAYLALPSGFSGTWDDLNDVGYNTGSLTPSVSTLIKWACGPLGYAKFYIPITLLILGRLFPGWLFGDGVTQP